MLFLLSPAKTLDYQTPAPELPHTRAQFASQAAELIRVLRELPPAVASLMEQYGGARLAAELNRRVAADRTPVVVNLASQEYARAVDRTTLKARVIDCVFEEWKRGIYKIVGFSAKRARGLMARHAITHRLDTPARLKGFDLEGYAFDAAASAADRLAFRRRVEQ